MTFHIYQQCVSTERFDVEAESKEEADEKHARGESTLEMDEVEIREHVKTVSAEEDV